jgi:sugar/nucleoside kinase (ribokinase family)
LFDIITIGSATRDVFLSSEGFKVVKDSDFATGQAECFGLGSKIEIKKILFTTGGGGTNAAVTFARQGLKTCCIGAIGNDNNGNDIVEELKKESVNTDYFQKSEDGELTAYSVILVNPNGERTILSYKGEGQNFKVDKIPFDKFKAGWAFLDSLGGHYDLLEGAVNWAVKNKVKLATNPGGKELAHGIDKLKPLFKYFSVVIMNKEEASKLTGIDYENEAKIFKYMDNIIDGIFVMTKGPEGVTVSDGENMYSAGVPDSPVVERTGAGDAFSSGFMVEYIRSNDIAKAIQMGTVNASSVVTKFGAKEGILNKDDKPPWPLVDVIQKLL